MAMNKVAKKERRKLRHELQALVLANQFSSLYKLRATPAQKKSDARKCVDIILSGKCPGSAQPLISMGRMIELQGFSEGL